MKYFAKLFFFIALAFAVGSCGHKKVTVTGGERYLKTIKGFSCKDAMIDEYGTLIIGIVPSNSSSYDPLAKSFLEEAKHEGVAGLTGCRVVNVNTYENIGYAWEK